MYRYCSPLARRKHIVIVIAVVVIVPAGRPRDAQKPTPAVYTPRREQKDPTNHRGPQNAGCSGRVGSPSDDDDDEIPCTTDTADKRDGTRFDDGVSSRESSERVRAGNRKKFGPPPSGESAAAGHVTSCRPRAHSHYFLRAPCNSRRTGLDCFEQRSRLLRRYARVYALAESDKRAKIRYEKVSDSPRYARLLCLLLHDRAGLSSLRPV